MTETPTSTSTPASNGKTDSLASAGVDILDKVQDVLKGGKIKGIRIKLGNKTVREIPVDVAAVSAVLLAAAAVLISQLKIEIDKG